MITRGCWQCLQPGRWAVIPSIPSVTLYQCLRCGWITVEAGSEQPDRREGTASEERAP